MPPFPFLHELDETERLETQEMSTEHRKIRDFDQEDSRHMISYRRDSGWDAYAKRGMLIYNVVQTMKPDDEVSRIFLGYTRMIIDKGIEQMTEGEPDFDFESLRPSDHLQVLIWKHLVRMQLSKCEYKLHQDTFFRDYFVTGSGVFETYIDYPRRTLRIPKGDGTFESVVTQDYRRPKVGVRALNPMNCWRNPNIDSPTQVPSCLRRRIITWNQFAQEIGRCGDENRYMNLDLLGRGTHVCLWYYQDEIRDVCRIYARTFGNESDGKATYPLDEDLGTLIFDQTLKIHEEKVNGVVTRSTGLNLPGMCTLRWGNYFDAYDRNYSGDHAVYGMGLPQRIEGEDTVMQTIFNMNIDNYRWASTTALNYKGANADSYIDVDANRFYGGELIDGEITPMSLGISRLDDYDKMQEAIDRYSIPSTGINHQQMVGDTSKTAFEFSQRIKMANRSAEQRAIRLESEVFKPVGTLVLANSLTTLTTKEYEDITEEDAARAREAIKGGRKPAGDYQDLNTANPKRRILQYIPLKGEKIREDFSVTKKRKLDYNAPFKNGKSTNTLINDPTMKVEISYIALTEEYVYPVDLLETGILPNCVPDAKRLLGDMKNQDATNFKTATDFLIQMYQVMGYSKIDQDKMASETLEFAGIDPKRILTTDTAGSKNLQSVKNALNQMQQYNSQPPQPPHAQLPPASPAQPPSSAAPAQPGGPGGAANPLQQAATGGL